jgi:glycerol uptake facilitator-like aquaporin
MDPLILRDLQHAARPREYHYGRFHPIGGTGAGNGNAAAEQRALLRNGNAHNNNGADIQLYQNPVGGLDDPIVRNTQNNNKAFKYWTGEEITWKWLLLHLLTELFGSFAFIFIGCGQIATDSGSQISRALAFSSAFTVVRSIRKSVSLDPFMSVLEFFIHLRRFGGDRHFGLLVLIMVSSIAVQVFGSYIGALMAFYYAKSVCEDTSACMRLTLTIVPKQTSYANNSVMLTEALFTFAMAYVSLMIQQQTIDEAEQQQQQQQANDPALVQIAPRTINANAATRANAVFDMHSIHYEPALIGVIYYTGMMQMANVGGGSLIFTRTLGPAFVLNTFTSVQVYFYGQVIGHGLAFLVFLLTTMTRQQHRDNRR